MEMQLLSPTEQHEGRKHSCVLKQQKEVLQQNWGQKRTRIETKQQSDKPQQQKKEGVKWLEDSSLSAVAYVFVKSNSYIVRIIWLVVLLAASGGFAYTTYDRIATLIRRPTATTISIEHKDELRFPAVTLCSLNLIRRDKVVDLLPQDPGLVNLSNVIGLMENTAECKSAASKLASTNNFNGGWGNLTALTGNNISEILTTQEVYSRRNDFCKFVGQDCGFHDFELTQTIGGLCYTFNGKAPFRTVKGTGVMQGLRLVLNPHDEQHSASFFADDGMKIVIHEPDEPPRPNAEGISVPPDKSVYIGMKEVRTIEDTRYSSRQCRDANDNRAFNFSRKYPYSTAACLDDCFHTSVADTCGCTEPLISTPDTSKYRQMRHCNLSDICCVKHEFFSVNQTCNCLPACNFTTRSFTISYSQSYWRTVQDNQTLSGAHIYYETLNVETRTTEDSYTPFSLISDIGGNSGLFLGFTLLTLVEVLMWLTGRCWGMCSKKKTENARAYAMDE